MAEILVAIQTADALLGLCGKLYRIGHDIIKATEEREQYRNALKGLENQLRSLKRLEDESRGHPAETYFDSLFQPAKVGQPSIGEHQGALVGMSNAMDTMSHHLRERVGAKWTMRRFRWTLDKKKFGQLLDDIENWRDQIQFLLQTAQALLDLKAFELESDTNQRMQVIQTVTAEQSALTHRIDGSTRRIEDSSQRLESGQQETNASLQSIRKDTHAMRLLKEKKRKEAEVKERKALHQRIAAWLTSLDFDTRQAEISNTAIDIGSTLLEAPEFQAWRSGRPWILFCWADAGAGKTMLSSLAVKDLRKHFTPQNVPVLCLYLNHKEQNTQTPRKVVLMVDALDEGSDETQRYYGQIFDQLPLDRLSVMITSREQAPEASQGIICDMCDKGPKSLFFRCWVCETDICYPCEAAGKSCGRPGHTLGETYEHKEVYLNINPSDDIIQSYVQDQIGREVHSGRSGRADVRLYKSQPRSTDLSLMCQEDPQLKLRIIDTICAKADRKFQLAKLYIDILKVKLNRSEVEQALKQLPTGYTAVYEQTMERVKAFSINNPDSNATSLAIATLSWIVHSKRPLDFAELQHALAIRLDLGFSRDTLYFKETLLRVTADLIMVESDDKAVRLTHATAQEYFETAGSKWFASNYTAHMTRSCIQYLCIKAIATPCNNDRAEDEFQQRRQDYPFLQYAYEYWGTHAKEVGSDPDTNNDVLQFLKIPEHIATFVQAMWYLDSAESSKWEIRKGANALHVAAWFGLTDVLVDLADSGVDVNAKDPGHEQTPLIYASRRGHREAVAKLLELGAWLNSQSARGSTAIVEAVKGGHSEVVRILAQKQSLKVNQQLLWDFPQTILMMASISDNLDILDTLLRVDGIDVNQHDTHGLTALMFACVSGRLEAMGRLIAHPKIDVNVADWGGRTPLIHAAECSDYGLGVQIARILIDNGANRSLIDKDGGGTVLMRAVDKGNSQMVEMLLEDGADFMETDLQHRGLLHAAAVNDRPEIADMLIAKGMDINIVDDKGRTPLHDACRLGSFSTARRLLELNADTSRKDHSQRTPPTVAWQNGNNDIADLLCSISDSSTISPLSDPSFLPTWSLAKLGHENILRQRIAHRTTDPYALCHLDPDTDDTPIHSAILSNHPTILLLLLEAGLSPNAQNAVFRTPLHHAALHHNNSLELTKILLSHSADPNIKDQSRTTPLWLAHTQNHKETVLLLIESGAEIEEKALILPYFFAAIEWGYTDAVRLLIEKYNAPVLAKNKYGHSASQVAKQNGRGEIMQLLLQNKSRYGMVPKTKSMAQMEELEDLRAPVPGPFTRPEVWKEKEEEEEQQHYSPETPDTQRQE